MMSDLSPCATLQALASAGALVPWIDACWEASPSGEASQSLILPDNCMDVLYVRGQWHVAGASTRAFMARMPAGEGAWGVRFKPGVLPLLCGVSAAEVVDQVVGFDEVWRGESPVEAWTRRLEALTGDVRLEMMSALHVTRATTARQLADELGWSARHMQRVLPTLLGYAPGKWLQVRRFDAMRRLLTMTSMTCAEIAAAVGYADESHMHRMCKRFADGHSPASLRRVLRAQASLMGEHSSTTTPLRSRT